MRVSVVLITNLSQWALIHMRICRPASAIWSAIHHCHHFEVTSICLQNKAMEKCKIQCGVVITRSFFSDILITDTHSSPYGLSVLSFNSDSYSAVVSAGPRYNSTWFYLDLVSIFVRRKPWPASRLVEWDKMIGWGTGQKSPNDLSVCSQGIKCDPVTLYSSMCQCPRSRAKKCELFTVEFTGLFMTRVERNCLT